VSSKDMVGGWREVNRKDAKTRRVLRILGLSVDIRDRSLLMN